MVSFQLRWCRRSGGCLRYRASQTVAVAGKFGNDPLIGGRKTVDRSEAMTILLAAVDMGSLSAASRHAKARGVYKGRPITLDHAKIIDLNKKGNGASAIGKAIGCSRGAVYKVLGP